MALKYSNIPQQSPYFRTGDIRVLWDQTFNGAAIAAADTIYFTPFILSVPISFTGGLIRCNTVGSGSSVKAAIWAASHITAKPVGVPLFADNTGVGTSVGTGDKALAFGNGTIGPGIYWSGVKTTGTPPVVTSQTSNAVLGNLIGIATGFTLNCNCFQFSDTYSNNMPTLTEGIAGLVPIGGVGPIIALVCA
jgi:hypothetical protein